jgi:hypothetical protein
MEENYKIEDAGWILTGVGVFLLYLFFKKHPGQSNIFDFTYDLPAGTSYAVPEMTRTPQIVPTPSTIMSLPLQPGQLVQSNSNGGACSCCISGGSINKSTYII